MTVVNLTVPFHMRIVVEAEDQEHEVGTVTVDAISEGPPLHRMSIKMNAGVCRRECWNEGG
jgi:hypothetical protein